MATMDTIKSGSEADSEATTPLISVTSPKEQEVVKKFKINTDLPHTNTGTLGTPTLSSGTLSTSNELNSSLKTTDGKREFQFPDKEKSKFSDKLSQGPKIKSILRRPKGEGEKKTRRKDAHGVLIHHGSKKHKITFKNEIARVEIVENWKKLNENNPQTVCCNVF